MMRLKKLVLLFCTLAILGTGGYYGYHEYEHRQFLLQVKPLVKNVSLRAENDLADIIAGKITWKELFDKFEKDILEIDGKIFDVQTISTLEAKSETDVMINYMRAVQNYLRS